MRKEFQMSADQLAALIEAGNPVMYIIAGGRGPMSPQESANNAWAALGSKLGFDHMSVQPVHGKGARYFTANEAPITAAQVPTWKDLVDKAIEVLNRHIVPDGISDKDALSELYGIFNGPEYRAVLAQDNHEKPA